MPESLETTARCLMDIHEIQNLMGRYEFLTAANMFTETVELFAKTTGADDRAGLVGEQLLRTVALRRRLRHDLDAHGHGFGDAKLRKYGFACCANLV